jgi:hypothetical protein
MKRVPNIFLIEEDVDIRLLLLEKRRFKFLQFNIVRKPRKEMLKAQIPIQSFTLCLISET